MAYCELVDFGDGPLGGKAWVRFTGPPPKLCQVCRKRRHPKLCDYPTGQRGHTCSKLLCDECATHIAPDSDYCPEHKEGPASLFRGPQTFIELTGKEPDPMPEHFLKSTVEASFWCKPCGKPTMHNVDNGRRGSCQVCIRKREAEPKQTPAAVQQTLFWK